MASHRQRAPAGHPGAGPVGKKAESECLDRLERPRGAGPRAARRQRRALATRHARDAGPIEISEVEERSRLLREIRRALAQSDPDAGKPWPSSCARGRPRLVPARASAHRRPSRCVAPARAGVVRWHLGRSKRGQDHAGEDRRWHPAPDAGRGHLLRRDHHETRPRPAGCTARSGSATVEPGTRTRHRRRRIASTLLTTMSWKPAMARAHDALDRAGMIDQAREQWEDLSDGERMRVALAQAIARGPDCSSWTIQ